VVLIALDTEAYAEDLFGAEVTVGEPAWRRRSSKDSLG
jgi:hypothetical protein